MRFMALGGTDHVGASCYFLELDGLRLLLDCGQGKYSSGKTFAPNYGNLLTEGVLDSLAQIDAILISHAHFDHIGALRQFADECSQTPILATEMTKKLGGCLLWDKLAMREDEKTLSALYKEFAMERALERIQTVAYKKPVQIGSVKVTFYEAGHIPGAAMIYLEGKESSVLYTGDYKKEPTSLTNGYSLPADIHPDVMILCGLHSKQPYHRPVNSFKDVQSQIMYWLKYGSDIFLHANQLTKGLEILKFCRQTLPDVHFYLDKKIWELAEQMELLGYPVLDSDCSCWTASGQRGQGIYIGGILKNNYFTKHLHADFSLHGTYADDVGLIKKTAAKNVFVVHAPPDKYSYDNDALKRDLPDVNIIYPQKGHLYSNN